MGILKHAHWGALALLAAHGALDLTGLERWSPLLQIVEAFL